MQSQRFKGDKKGEFEAHKRLPMEEAKVSEGER